MLSRLVIAALAAVAAVPAAAAPTGACTCTGAVADGKCYPTLASAFDAVSSGGTIEVGGKTVLTKPIFFNKSVKLEGVECSGKKAVISAKMDAGEGGMLEVRGPDRVSVRISNIDFTREAKSGSAAAFRGGVMQKDVGDKLQKFSAKDAPPVDLTLRRCNFYGLHTKARGGSAVYILNVGNVDIDSSNSFYDNVVARPPKARWGGGGALWLVELNSKNTVDISATWRNNEHLFEHGNGGAIMIELLRGKVNIGGRFLNNRASDGGAIHIRRVQSVGKLNINGHFENNQAVEYGWGSRAGAIRLQYILGNAVVDGTFINNKAGSGRGGVIATNRFYEGGCLTIRGTYSGNFAASSGGVFDQSTGGAEYSYVMERGSSLTIDGSCKFISNVAEKRPITNIANIGPLGETLRETHWKGETVVYHGQDKPMDKPE